MGLIALLLGGCETIPMNSYVNSHKEYILRDLCEVNNIPWDWDYIAQVVTMGEDFPRVRLLIGSNVVLIGDKEVTLSSSVRIISNSIIVPADFQWKVIDRMLKPKAVEDQKDYSLRGVRTIVIDAGHGGYDPGAIGISGLKEKLVVLDIAKRVKVMLDKKGFETRMTRSSDSFISLKKRTEIASCEKADLFISIHANSSPSKSVHGIEVFSSKNLDYARKNEDQRKRNQYLLYQKLNMEAASDLKGIVSGMMYLHKQKESSQLASKVINSVSKSAKIKNRGIKKSHFFVLRNTLMPAILVEVGFLTNSKEEKKLKTNSHRHHIARGIVKGIGEYINGK